MINRRHRALGRRHKERCGGIEEGIQKVCKNAAAGAGVWEGMYAGVGVGCGVGRYKTEAGEGVCGGYHHGRQNRKGQAK